MPSHLRADRFLTLRFAQPLRRWLPPRRTLRIPILMYHSISNSSRADVHPYFVTETSARAFEAQMKFLHQNGYVTIAPEDIVTLLESKQVEAGKYVVITFDDGYRDFYTNAYPVLDKYGFLATVYLPTAYINRDKPAFKDKPCMSWAEVRELHEAGVLFGSHTINHLRLQFVPFSALEYEVKISKETIEDELGAPVRSFAYPYAFPEEDSGFAHRLRDLLGVCGYENGVSTVIGTVQSWEERFFMRRLPANEWDDAALFRAKLEGSYDWMHVPQYLYKKLASLRRDGTEPEDSSATVAEPGRSNWI